MIVNAKNGKYYIGQTVRDVKVRFDCHVRNAKFHKNMPICRAILKHGAENFSYTVLTKCESIKEMNEAEATWISRLDATNPRKGYNLAGGGGGYGKRSAEQRERMSKLRKGIPATEAQMKGLRAGWKRGFIPKTIWTPERRAVSSRTIKQVVSRPGHGERVSAGKKGKPMHPNALANLRLGPRSQTPETQRKKSDAMKKYWSDRRAALKLRPLGHSPSGDLPAVISRRV